MVMSMGGSAPWYLVMVRCHLLAWILAGDVLVEVVQAMLRLVIVTLGGRYEARVFKAADA